MPVLMRGFLITLAADINIVERSPVVNQQILRRDLFSKFRFTAADQTFDQLYYLVDGIYPSFACFLPTISKPTTAKEKLFAKTQERSKGRGASVWRAAVAVSDSQDAEPDVVRKRHARSHQGVRHHPQHDCGRRAECRRPGRVHRCS